LRSHRRPSGFSSTRVIDGLFSAGFLAIVVPVLFPCHGQCDDFCGTWRSKLSDLTFVLRHGVRKYYGDNADTQSNRMTDRCDCHAQTQLL
jgi:hypothetical protein